jgi:hypothetical protein
MVLQRVERLSAAILISGTRRGEGRRSAAAIGANYGLLGIPGDGLLRISEISPIAGMGWSNPVAIGNGKQRSPY